jgi:hypothetical protein
LNNRILGIPDVKTSLSGERLFAADRCSNQAIARLGEALLTHVMASPSTAATQEALAGLVERVTFHNAESGFCVLRARARGHRDLVTIVGHAAVISAGEWITATGEWVNDRTHGQQFRARFLKTSAPTSVDGIERYLAGRLSSPSTHACLEFARVG